METQNLQVTNIPTVFEQEKPSTAAEIQAWIVSYLADLLEVEPDEVNVKIPFDRYNLDSSAAIGMTGDLEDWLGYELDPTLLYDYPTIELLTQYLDSLK